MSGAVPTTAGGALLVTGVDEGPGDEVDEVDANASGRRARGRTERMGEARAKAPPVDRAMSMME